MSKSKAKIWARLIYKGEKTIDDVPKADRALVKETYLELYGEPINGGK